MDDNFSEFGDEFNEDDYRMMDDLEKTSCSETTTHSTLVAMPATTNIISENELSELSNTNSQIETRGSNEMMSPPTSTYVPRKRRVQQATPTTSARMPIPTKKPKSLQSEFFANWQTDELSSYEKKIKDIKRRFPGPAGLLPPIDKQQIDALEDPANPFSQRISQIIKNDLIRECEDIRSKKTLDPSTSPERQMLNMPKGPWRELLRLLKLHPREPDCILNMMNIKWVNKMSGLYPVSIKIPFLAVVIAKEDHSLLYKTFKSFSTEKANEISRCMHVMDATGRTAIAIDATLNKVHGNYFKSGTAIAIQDVGFLRFKRQSILLITQNSLMYTVSMPESASGLPDPENQEKDGLVVKKFKEWCPELAFQKYWDVIESNKNPNRV